MSCFGALHADTALHLHHFTFIVERLQSTFQYAPRGFEEFNWGEFMDNAFFQWDVHLRQKDIFSCPVNEHCKLRKNVLRNQSDSVHYPLNYASMPCMPVFIFSPHLSLFSALAAFQVSESQTLCSIFLNQSTPTCLLHSRNGLWMIT